MAMVPHFDTDILRRLSSKMLAAAQKYAPHSPAASGSTATLAIDLILPPPKTLTPQLLELGVDKSSANRISSAMMNAASRLKAICEADFQRRLVSLQSRAHHFQDPKSLNRLPSTYLTIYTKTLTDWVSYLLEDITPRVLAAQARSRNFRSQSRRPFNQNALRTLESFFERNAFPSKLEKSELAYKCDLSYKQIRTWFQNRRSRCRKEGKELRQPAPRPGVLGQLETTVMDALLPSYEEEEEEENDDDDDDDDGVDVEVTSSPGQRLLSGGDEALNSGPPEHAYPCPYPPLCRYDPFPSTPEERALQTIWPPRSQPSRLAPAPSDISDLIAAFSRLSIAEDTQSSMLASHTKHPCDTTGFLTPCVRAPLSALVLPRGPASIPMSVLPVARCRTKRAPSSAPTVTSGPCRNKRALPRRLPRHPPTGYRLHKEASPFPTRISRNSVTYRAASLSSTSASSVTSGSDADSPLSTPSLLPVGVDSSLAQPKSSVFHPHVYALADIPSLDLEAIQTGIGSDWLESFRNLVPSSA